MKGLILAMCIFFPTFVFSQSITNSLGTDGVFTIKDATNNFLTLSQSTGEVNILKSLRLENTTSLDLGIIFKGSDRFIHNYQPPTVQGNNTYIGINSGNFTMTGTSTTSCSNNTGIGYNSLFNSTTGSLNTGVGSFSLFNNAQANSNTGIGYSSLYSNISGNGNTAVGSKSLYANTIGSGNTAIGNLSLTYNTEGIYNTAVGNLSLGRNTLGEHNTAVGFHSMFLNSDGSYNTAVGYEALDENTVGTYNTALGYVSLQSNTIGFNNTAIGFYSLVNNTTGDSNTALGSNSGQTVTTGNNLTLIGYGAEPTSGIATDQITLGNSSVTSLRCNVTTISSLSDSRDKKNIKDLSLGLDFLMRVKPRMFNWDKREWYEGNNSDGSKMKEVLTAGFIAQELDEAQTSGNAEWLNLVLKENPEKLEATYGNLLPVMVKAIQDLKYEKDELKNEVQQLKSKNENLVSEVESLKRMNEKIVNLEKIINEMNSIKHSSFKKEEVILKKSKGVSEK